MRVRAHYRRDASVELALRADDDGLALRVRGVDALRESLTERVEQVGAAVSRDGAAVTVRVPWVWDTPTATSEVRSSEGG